MTQSVFFNLLTVAVLFVGMFFLFTGAMGVLRLPDLYHRMIAASKGGVAVKSSVVIPIKFTQET